MSCDYYRIIIIIRGVTNSIDRVVENRFDLFIIKIFLDKYDKRLFNIFGTINSRSEVSTYLINDKERCNVFLFRLSITFHTPPPMFASLRLSDTVSIDILLTPNIDNGFK